MGQFARQFSAIIIAVFFLGSYAYADCVYELRYMSPDGVSRSYSLSELRNFVVSEIRPRSLQDEKTAWIKISRNCNGNASAVDLQIRTDTHTLTNINGIEIDGRYDEQNIEISRGKFGYYFSAAEMFAQKNRGDRLEIFKFFSYLFTEAARFEVIEERLDDLFARNCRVNWAESKRLFRRLERMSAFASALQIKDVDYAAGKNNSLATISKTIMSAYAQEALDGKNTLLDEYVDPRDFGWQVTFDTPACSAQQLTRQEERDEILTFLAFSVVLNDWQVGKIKLRRGHNIGAVLADQNGFPIFWARNASMVLDDASQHGEVRLIQNYLSCNGVGSYARGLTVYSTLEPCAMCSGMMMLTQVDRVVYGQDDPDFGGAVGALLAINYPNVYEETPLNVSDIKTKLDATYKSARESEGVGITSFFLRDQAKSLFEDAKKRLFSYQVRYPENRAVLSAAIQMAMSAKAEDPLRGLRANCPTN